MLPARNAAEHLDEWFACVEHFADAVVALDDGSTDDTKRRLDTHPLVRSVLTNPRRETYEGWNDAENRSRLLASAAAFEPAWIMQLDADERIPADDAVVLGDFLRSGASDRSFAYEFRVHRMIGGLEWFDKSDLWVGRLFGFDPSHHFPGDALHFVPLPTSIPRSRWVRTTVRIQHLAGVDEESRRVRHDKYLETDPGNEHQASYEHLLDPPSRLERWRPRPPRLPVVGNGSWHRESHEAGDERDVEPDAPTMSVVVISRDDEATISDAVAAVTSQDCDEPLDVIVVSSGSDRTAEIVRERFPEVRVVQLDGVAYPGRARNAGLAIARGRYVSFPGSHVRLPPGSLQARLHAHRRGYAMVTGTTLNGNTTRAGWASYFLDNHSVLPGRPSTRLEESPAHCSYLREALVAAGGFREDMRAGEDTLVNNRLFAAGYGAWRDQDVRLYHHPRSTNVTQLARHHFSRGRAFARVLMEQTPEGKRLLTRRFLRSTLVRYVPGRYRRVGRNVRAWGDDEQRHAWADARMSVLAAITASWMGTWFEMLRPGGEGLRMLTRRSA